MKKTLLILGAGTGGTMLVNKCKKKLDLNQWRIVIVDKEPAHYYQSDYLGLVFGTRTEKQISKPKKKFIPEGVEMIFAEVEAIVPGENRVLLRPDDRVIEYDQLVIATGADIYPEENPGLLGSGWQSSIFDFYTFAGAKKLQSALKSWQGGRLVVNIAEMPVKCLVAPLEFLFLADQYFKETGLRSKVELSYTLPSEVFTQPEITPIFNSMIAQKNIQVQTDFYFKNVDPDKQVIYSYAGQEMDYDMLVTIPTNMGAKMVGRSGLGDEFRFIPVDMYTLQTKDHENIWVIGDAADLPCPKTASAIHSMSDTVVENVLRLDSGKSLANTFAGETKCIVYTGGRRSLLLAFSYTQPPKPGKYPLPVVGPFSVLKSNRINYAAKRNLLWMYWNMFLPARYTPARYTRG